MDKKRNWKKWAIAAGKRAAKTFAQAVLAEVTVGYKFTDIDWATTFSIAGVAAVISRFTSLAGIPEEDMEV